MGHVRITSDIFMGMIEAQLNEAIKGTFFYKRYVDDVLVIFNHPHDMAVLLNELNAAHPNLKFTSEVEKANSLAFLDVLITRKSDGSIQRSIFRKKTWSEQYLHFNSFSPIEHERALVRTLFYRARKICTEDTIPSEQENIYSALRVNGYPECFVRFHSRIGNRIQATTLRVPKKSIHISLPYKRESIMQLITQRIKNALQRTYYAATLRLHPNTRRLPLSPFKDHRPVESTSHCIYAFGCRCNEAYIGRTDRSLRTIPFQLQVNPL
ncbi:unnamed protein product [Echinostoma caproni]|uniref:Reverse transcriptase domain-containing protein n=1 Tax=Echinostoma caproni TaxID=27848 RepID=A0A183AP80_9TREM|nr:unnamed protein product [Echinostoma caproni]